MRILFIVALFSFIGCSGQKKEASNSISCSYVAATQPDSTKNVFAWKPVYKISDTSGPTIFNWQVDSSLEITYKSSYVRPNIVKFYKVKLRESETKLFPSVLLGDKFKFAGVYEDEKYRGSGFYLAFYCYKNMVLIQHLESLRFITYVTVLMDVPENVFEKAGFVFPYKKSIDFRTEL